MHQSEDKSLVEPLEDHPEFQTKQAFSQRIQRLAKCGLALEYKDIEFINEQFDFEDKIRHNCVDNKQDAFKKIDQKAVEVLASGQKSVETITTEAQPLDPAESEKRKHHERPRRPILRVVLSDESWKEPIVRPKKFSRKTDKWMGSNLDPDLDIRSRYGKNIHVQTYFGPMNRQSKSRGKSKINRSKKEKPTYPKWPHTSRRGLKLSPKEEKINILPKQYRPKEKSLVIKRLEMITNYEAQVEGQMTDVYNTMLKHCLKRQEKAANAKKTVKSEQN